MMVFDQMDDEKARAVLKNEHRMIFDQMVYEKTNVVLKPASVDLLLDHQMFQVFDLSIAKQQGKPEQPYIT